MKFFRNFALLFTAVLLFTAACGDDVTVVGPKNGRDTVQVPVLVKHDTVVVHDTIFVHDTVQVEKIVHDTIFKTVVDTVEKIVVKWDTLVVTRVDTVFKDVIKWDTVFVTKTDTVYLPTPPCDPTKPAGLQPKECRPIKP